MEVSNANGYFYLNYEEGPPGNSAGGFEYPHAFTEEERAAEQLWDALQKVGRAANAELIMPGITKKREEMAAKRTANHAAGMADCEKEEKLNTELLALIKATP